MQRHSKPIKSRASRSRLTGLALSALLLSTCLVLLSGKTASGRWHVPQTAVPGQRGYPLRDRATGPTATPVPVPAQAEVPILMYHYVSEIPPDANAIRRGLTVLPEMFRAQLQYLADEGYHPIALADLYHHLTQGYPLPEKPISLTFDDGYRDAYEVVFPTLLEYGFTGTFFVLATPTHQGSPDYMTWEQMREMAEAGMEIEGHGRDHLDLRGRSYDYLVYQILGIQEAITQNTGYLPRFFCYPSGQYDANVIAVLESAGYWGAVTTRWGRTHTYAERYELRRLRIEGRDTLWSFIDKLED